MTPNEARRELANELRRCGDETRIMREHLSGLADAADLYPEEHQLIDDLLRLTKQNSLAADLVAFALDAATSNREFALAN